MTHDNPWGAIAGDEKIGGGSSDERMRLDAKRKEHRAQRFAELWPAFFDDMGGGVDVVAKCKRVHAQIAEEWNARS